VALLIITHKSEVIAFLAQAFNPQSPLSLGVSNPQLTRCTTGPHMHTMSYKMTSKKCVKWLKHVAQMWHDRQTVLQRNVAQYHQTERDRQLDSEVDRQTDRQTDDATMRLTKGQTSSTLVLYKNTISLIVATTLLFLLISRHQHPIKNHQHNYCKSSFWAFLTLHRQVYKW